MKYKPLWATLIAGTFAAGAAFLATPSRADHASSPKEVVDPQANILDVYAFMRPGGGADAGPSSHIVLVMTMNPAVVKPSDPDAGIFDDKVEYTFRVNRVASLTPFALVNTDYRITCHFIATTPQQVTCIIPGIGPQTVQVDPADAGSPNDSFRIWAGLRSDPAFFDLNAFNQSLTSGSLKFAGTGTNAYQGKNVLALVIEVNVAEAFNFADAGSPTPILAVAGEATRQ